MEFQIGSVVKLIRMVEDRGSLLSSDVLSWRHTFPTVCVCVCVDDQQKL